MYPLSPEHFSEWNSYVFHHPQGEIGHLAEWSLIFNEAFNYKPYFSFVKENQKIFAIVPVIFQKGFFKKLLVTAQPGILTDQNSQVEDYVISRLIELKEQTKSRDLILTNILKQTDGFHVSDENVRISLCLPSDISILWKSIGVKQRNMIRKAESHGLKFSIETPDERSFRTFYRIYSENYRDLGTPVNPASYFRLQMKYLSGFIKVLLVEFKGKIIGAMWLHQFRQQMSDPEAASLRKFFYTGVNDFMHYRAFEYAIGEGCTQFNMGRSQRGSGTFNFKKKWGNIEIESYPLSKMNKVETIGEKKNRYSVFISIWKHSPVFITNYFGPLLRKHTVLD